MTALFVIWLSVAQRRTEGSLRRARDDLQATVRELEKQNKRCRPKTPNGHGQGGSVIGSSLMSVLGCRPLPSAAR